MARARVENHIDRVRRHAAAGPSRHPGVLADLEADLDAAAIEDQIADRILLTVDFDLIANVLRPRLEPTRLVVQAVAAEKSLGDESRDLPVDRQAGAVEQGAAVEERQAKAHDHAFRGRHNLLQHGQRGLLQARAVKSVLAAIAGDAQLGQAKDARPLGPRRLDRGKNVVAVAGPIHRRLIEHGGGDSNARHG